MNKEFYMKSIGNKSVISRIVTILLVLYPMISVYNSPVGTLCLADTMLIMVLPLAIIKLFSVKYVRINKILLFFTVFVIANFVIVMITITQEPLRILRNQAHFALVLTILTIIVPNFFDGAFGIKLLCYSSYISSVYLLLQIGCNHIFNVYLKAHVSFLQANISENGHIRPFAFFSEPATFGFYNAVGLATILMIRPFEEKKNKVIAMITSLAMLLSLSTTAVALLVIIWIWYLFKSGKLCGKNQTIKKSTILIILIMVILFIIADSKIHIIAFIYEHVVPVEGQKMAGGVSGRLGNIKSIGVDYSISQLSKIIGLGMIDLKAFIPGIARVYVYFGYIGCGVVGCIFLMLFQSAGSYGKLLLLLAISNSFFADSIFGLAMFGYIQYVICDVSIANKNRICFNYKSV